MKVMGRMNIAEKRLPQDGRATVQIGDRIDRPAHRDAADQLRRARRHPPARQEHAAVRPARARHGAARSLAHFHELVTMEHGLMLVTGPTGSGKSTTLYAALNADQQPREEHPDAGRPDRVPARGDQPDAGQRASKGMTFASGLRSVLRQDPDVIMVGEIRDRETAMMAIQSVPDRAPGLQHAAHERRRQRGGAAAGPGDRAVPAWPAAWSGVLAQRLVRRLCPECAAEAAGAASWRGSAADVDGAAGTPKAAAGCAACRQTGYRGRRGIFELLLVDDTIRRQIQARATASEIDAAARRPACGRCATTGPQGPGRRDERRRGAPRDDAVGVLKRIERQDVPRRRSGGPARAAV